MGKNILLKTNTKIRHKLGNIKLGIIGFGNVGQNIFYALKKNGMLPRWVVTTKLANLDATKIYTSLNQINQSVDLILVCVKDEFIERVSSELPTFLKETVVVAHTSGIFTWEEMNDKIKHRANFYPVQTISKERALDWTKIPIVVSAETTYAQQKLEALAQYLGASTYGLDVEQKKQLHLAAVFANNFVNHFWEIANELCTQKQVPVEILTAIREETLAKFVDAKINHRQTGPAFREDTQTMEIHRKLLQKSPALASIYQLISQHIITYHHGKKL